MRVKNKISQIKAETLLNYLYPEGDRDWIARDEGSFYRNYNYDLLSFDDDSQEVVMARDGFLEMLPQGVLTLGDDMNGEDSAEKYKKVQRRLKILREAFVPFDTFNFRQEVTQERLVSELLQVKLSHILHTYFDIDIDKIESPLVREMVVLLPYVSSKRGDFGFIGSILGALLHCHVVVITGRYSKTDTTRSWTPRVRFELQIPGLSPEEYREKDETLEPLREFICEWFIPVEVKCEIVIKDHQSERQTNTRLTLGYNTELNQ